MTNFDVYNVVLKCHTIKFVDPDALYLRLEQQSRKGLAHASSDQCPEIGHVAQVVAVPLKRFQSLAFQRTRQKSYVFRVIIAYVTIIF
jgi:hypothetical protein